MSVVGFDLGYQSSHIAVARHGGVEMVTNEYSDRRSPTMLGFSHKNRCMGISAKSQLVMNPKNTVWGFKNFVGRKFSDPFVQEEMKKYPYEVVELPNDGVGVKVHYSGEEHVFTPEQLLAVMLTYLKQTTEKALGKPVVDCVISVPSHFTDAQRRATLDASTIAGLNCLRLMNDTTAVALAYGIYKQDLPEEKEKARNVVFVSMGHSCLQVLIAAFQKGKLKVLSKASEPLLGGRDFDQRIMSHFAAEFKKKYNVDSLSRPRQRLRLTNECEKLKKNMSANTTPIPINIDSLADDKDVMGHMKRDDFDEMCSDLLQRVKTPLQDALKKSGLKLEDIDAVEVVGGGCRMRGVKDAIIEVFQMQLSTTLNMDEAVARGCALQCAMLSPTFKVRDFSITDIQPYPIKLKWHASMEGEDGEMVVYKEGDAIYHSKVLTFYRKEPFELEASYEKPDEIPYPDPVIGKFRVKNVAPTEEGDSSKVKVKVRVNIHGVFYVKSATMVEKVKPEEEIMETEPTDASSQQSQANGGQANGGQANGTQQEAAATAGGGGEGGSTEESQQQQQTNATPSESTDAPMPEVQAPPTEQEATPTEQQPEATPTEQQPEATPTDQQQATPPEQNAANGKKESPKTGKKEGKESEAKKPKKPTVRYVDLPIDDRTSSLSKTVLDRAHEKEVNMAYQDQLEKQRQDAKNAVEEYVYNMRDKLEYGLREFISDGDRTKFLELLNATEEWLYDEGEDQPKKVYVSRLDEMKKLGDPVVQREQELQERPHCFNELGATIIHYEKILEQYAAGEEQYNHLEEAEMEKVREAVKGKREWLNSQMQTASRIPKHANPPVTCAQIRAEKANLETGCNPIVTKPKPKVEPPKEEPKPAAEGGEGEKDAKMEEEKPEGGQEEATMEEDSKSATEQQEPDDMELD